MEYRKLPRGNENEGFSAPGLGLGGIGQTPGCIVATARSAAPLASSRKAVWS